ncbi:hypothetical protein RHSIM_RhsimUnG0162200 [Rhododendron simsii]|uniref:Insecticidal crystal toxin domain-containing protein n=1 Tax=Rhododendron simsii TaxID=118357 RepID=A0A834FUL7_RHOSS|nr:hypothetical protein RHSIM_RhsimUnG0162200 [Rhododendron simsii]
MYVTRRLSQYQRSPGLLSLPPEGPNSGYLVIQDKESETTNFLGFKKRHLKDLPFPQNKSLIVQYSDDNDAPLTLIPVLNQPLSSNRYYAIKARGSRKGEAYACSREEDMTPSCFCDCIMDVNPRPLNPNDIYQQFEIFPYKIFFGSGGTFSAKSVAPDGLPPHFLRSSGWQIFAKTPKTYELGEALGINTTLRACLPNFDSPVVVGKWYCPFMFVKDGNLKDQMKRSLFYEMTLEQRWEKIFACENNFSSKGNSISVEAEVKREVAFVGGREAVKFRSRVGDGWVWFRDFGGVEQVIDVGLSSLIVDRMKWEEERGGWVREGNRQVMVKRTEEFGGINGGGWSKFGCYVLVERFVLKRMDGSVVLTYDFKHTHVIRSKWE